MSDRRMVVQRTISGLVAAGMLAWLAWLASMGRSKLEYVVAKARTHSPLVACTWVPIATPALATLGLSFEPDHAWTERSEVLLAFRTPLLVPPAFVQLRLVAMVGRRVTMGADGGRPIETHAAGEVRLPLRERRGDDVHTVSIRIGKPLPPHGNDERWLGVAVSAIRVCGTSSAADG